MRPNKHPDFITQLLRPFFSYGTAHNTYSKIKLNGKLGQIINVSLIMTGEILRKWDIATCYPLRLFSEHFAIILITKIVLTYCSSSERNNRNSNNEGFKLHLHCSELLLFKEFSTVRESVVTRQDFTGSFVGETSYFSRGRY